MNSTNDNQFPGAAEDGPNTEEQLAELGGVEIIYKPLDKDQIPSEIQKNLKPAADETRRLVLARNVVPMPPREMALTLFCLMDDENPAVREAAENSLDSLPPNIIRTIAGQNIHWKVLDYIARNSFSDDDEFKILETIILNPATGVETMMLLARVSSRGVVDLVINNQTRLQKTPQIVSEFSKNTRISIAQLSRALEFGRRMKLITIDQENRMIDLFIGKVDVQEIEVEEVVEQVIDKSGEVDWAFPSFMTSDFEADLDLDAEADVIESKILSKLNLREFVRKMTVPQKLRLAGRGNMEARKILIQDALALVSVAVLSNPRLTSTEVGATAEMRMTDPEVLEEISKKAAFTRSYQVRHALVWNPKTPLQIASKMMSTLTEKDIKTISKSRAVSQAISSIARQRLDAQAVRRKKREKKKKK